MWLRKTLLISNFKINLASKLIKQNVLQIPCNFQNGKNHLYNLNGSKVTKVFKNCQIGFQLNKFWAKVGSLILNKNLVSTFYMEKFMRQVINFVLFYRQMREIISVHWVNDLSTIRFVPTVWCLMILQVMGNPDKQKRNDLAWESTTKASRGKC